MTTSNEPLTKPSAFNPKRLVFALLAISPIGFIDATFLTINHYTGAIPPCSIVKGCEQVTTSVYSSVFGIPIALVGALYYLTVIVGLILYLDTRRAQILKLVAWFTTVGFVASLGLVFLQLFVIRAICIYCMVSAATSTVLFIFGIMVLRRQLVFSSPQR